MSDGPMPANDARKEIWTVGKLLAWTTPFFQKKGIESPRLDAELLLAHVLGIKRIELYTGFDRPLTEAELAAFRALVKRRAQREPVAYILGTRGFHQIALAVDVRVLIPRPETELLVELAIKKLPHAARFADIGTGSGAIALAVLAARPDLTAIATDVSAEALEVAGKNAKALGLETRIELRQGDLDLPLRGEKFAAVLSNPPYVAGGAALAPEVVDFEPHAALFAGPEGLEILARLLEVTPALLSEGGFVAFELGIGQKDALRALAGHFAEIVFHADLAGIPRVLEARGVVETSARPGP